MPKSDYQKARLFAVYQILREYTDDTHSITMKEILNILKKDYEITSTRQTIESDFSLLSYPLNIFIDETFDKPKGYYLSERLLSSDDIIKIAASVQQNCSLSAARQKDLIEKLKFLGSKHERKKINLNTFSFKDKSDSLSERYSAEIEEAIDKKYKIILDYNFYSFSGTKMTVTTKTYTVVPLHSYFYEGKTYLCAYGLDWTAYNYEQILSQNEKEIYIFDVDQIISLEVKTYNPSSIPLPSVEEIGSAIENTTHSIYQGKTETITMELDNALQPFARLRFGSALNIDSTSDKKFHITQETVITPEFFAWVLSLGTGAKLLSPLHVVENMKYWIKSCGSVYGITSTYK